jgi:signal transduction histidine kinase
MATANDHADTLVDALRRGANDYLVKPINIQVAAARIRTQLSLSELVRMKDEFLAFASHDLKKPLMLEEDILSHLRAELNPGNSVGADVPELLDLLLKANRDMQGVVRAFLDGNARGIASATPVKEAVALNGMVEEVVRNNTSYSRRKRVRLEAVLDASGPGTVTDAFRVRQVLENLVNNALKFSPPDTVTTVAARVDAGEVVVEVRDNGPGLRDDDLAKLFRKNAQLSNRPTGGEHSSGVGLAMCKELIGQIGGRIGARNNADGGATFWIRLPRST